MTRVHVIIRATVDLDPDAAQVELYEPLQAAAAVGLANAVCTGMSGVVAEVLSCAVLEVLEVDPEEAWR